MVGLYRGKCLVAIIFISSLVATCWRSAHASSLQTRQKHAQRPAEYVESLDLFWNEESDGDNSNGSGGKALSQTKTIQSKQKTLIGELAQVFGRNVLVENSGNSNTNKGLDIDMKHFLHACETYADVMRRAGQDQSAKDLTSNIKKVQNLYQVAPSSQRTFMSSLLQYEKDLNVHPDVHPEETEDNPKYAGQPKKRLKDPSAAMGLLWIRRSVAFNTQWYSMLCTNEKVDPKEAAFEAYRNVLEPFHGWALRRLSTMGISSVTPPRAQLLATLAGRGTSTTLSREEEQGVLQDLKTLVSIWQPLLSVWTQTFETLDLDDRRRA